MEPPPRMNVPQKAVDIVTHIETGRIEKDDKFMLVLAARRLIIGFPITATQSSIWRRYGGRR